MGDLTVKDKKNEYVLFLPKTSTTQLICINISKVSKMIRQINFLFQGQHKRLGDMS